MGAPPLEALEPNVGSRGASPRMRINKPPEGEKIEPGKPIAAGNPFSQEEWTYMNRTFSKMFAEDELREVLGLAQTLREKDPELSGSNIGGILRGLSYFERGEEREDALRKAQTLREKNPELSGYEIEIILRELSQF